MPHVMVKMIIAGQFGEDGCFRLVARGDLVSQLPSNRKVIPLYFATLLRAK
jgi:hypothetical protein